MDYDNGKRREEDAPHWRHWRAWGSWHSWGSPVGIALGFFLVAVGFGVFLYLFSMGGYTGLIGL